MIALFVLIMILTVVVLVQFTVWTVNRDVMVRLRRDNDDKMKVILNLSETQAENVRTIVQITSPGDMGIQLDDSYYYLFFVLEKVDN